MSFLLLSELVVQGRDTNYPVARRHDALIAFGQFARDVSRVAAGIRPSARVVITCEDAYRFVVTLFAVLHAGGTALLPSTVQQLGAESYDMHVDDVCYATLCVAEPVQLQSIDPQRESIHFYTSGSTGVPKPVPKSLHMFEEELWAIEKIWGGDHQQVLSTVPHHHLYGLTFSILWPLAAGYVFETAMHHFWESVIAESTPQTVVISSPAHLERLGGIAPLPAASMPRWIFSAGAPLSFDAAQQAAAIMGCLPVEIFGSTETGAIATRQQAYERMEWQMLPGISMQCDADQRLVIRSPFIGPDAYVTNDMVEPSEKGFHFLGRADRVVKISGKRVHLAYVEQCLMKLPEVAEAAVIALTQGGRLEVGAAVVLTEAGKIALSESTVFQFRKTLGFALAPNCEPASIPRRWRFIEALPAHPLGKRRDRDIAVLFGEVA